MNKYTIYIGANNTTKEVEKDILIKELSEFCNAFNTGFTIVESVGYWNGEMEKSVIVTILDTDINVFDIVGICNVLKDKLQQNSILVEFTEAKIRLI